MLGRGDGSGRRPAARIVPTKQKMATCQFGADQQRLQGEARDAFLKKCMEDQLTLNGRHLVRTRMHARVEIINEFTTNGTRAGAGAGTRHRNCCE